MADDVLIGDTPKARRRRKRLDGVSARGRLWKHSTLADIDGLVSPADIAGMFVFTLVRNPWDRMISFYTWAREQTFDHPTVEAAKTLDFWDFLMDPGVSDTFRKNPARAYVTDATGTERCDVFVRLEHLDSDLAPLWDHLGFRVEIPHLNASDRSGDYRDWYDKESRNRVADLMSEDIDRFGYSF